MGLWEMVVIVTIIGCVYCLIDKWLDRRAGLCDLKQAAAPEDGASMHRLLRDLDKMERRMENLETILLERAHRAPAEKL